MLLASSDAPFPMASISKDLREARNGGIVELVRISRSLVRNSDWWTLSVMKSAINPENSVQPTEPSRVMRDHPRIVACLGSSSTAGKGQAFNWIAELQRRLGDKRFVFRNFGVGGDLAYNALQRLSDLTGSNPERTVVFIGGNDVLALVSTKARTFFRGSKRLPRDPSPEWFRENLQAIVRRVKAETSSRVALCSLPPIGEDPASANPFQSELNRRIEEFSAIIRGTAQEERIDYIAPMKRYFCKS
jgi:lysophospholipase L1-like esterase